MDDQGKGGRRIGSHAEEDQRLDHHKVPRSDITLHGEDRGDRDQREDHQCHVGSQPFGKAKSLKCEVECKEVTEPDAEGVEEEEPPSATTHLTDGPQTSQEVEPPLLQLTAELKVSDQPPQEKDHEEECQDQEQPGPWGPCRSTD